MGCFAEFFVEFFLEIFAELFGKEIFGFLKRAFHSEKGGKVLYVISVILAVLLSIIPILGIFLVIQPDGSRVVGWILIAFWLVMLIAGVISFIKKRGRSRRGKRDR